LPTDPANTAAQALRARIHAHFTELHHELEAKKTQRKTLTQQSPPAADIDLIDLLPTLPGRIYELPEPIQADIFAALDIQILWNAPMRQATYIATIPGVVTALLNHAGNDPASAGQAKPDTAPTSNNPVAGFSRLPMLTKSATPGGHTQYRGSGGWGG
jgi:hypothetical protein